MNQSKTAVVDTLNRDLLLSGAGISAWFSVRGSVLGPPSGFTVLLEWLLLLFCAAVLCAARGRLGVRGPTAFLTAITVTLYLVVSMARQNDMGQLSMYWRGFGWPLVLTLVAGLLATLFIVTLTHNCCLRFRFNRRSPIIHKGFDIVSLAIIVWLIPTVLQPMDGWLNIGDATAYVLDEITAPVAGNLPGYNQAAGYSSFLGFPLWPLSLVPGQGPEKLTIIVMWVNLLVLLIPLLIATILRQIQPSIPRLFAFVIGLITVTISGNPHGNDASLFSANTSLFRELSFMVRGLLPLVVGLLAIIIFSRQSVDVLTLMFIAAVTAIAILNNLEFGIGCAAAISVMILVRFWHTSCLVKNLTLFLLSVGTSIVILVSPGMLTGGDWIGRRLGLFAAVLSGQGNELSRAVSRNLPALGLVAVTYSVAIAAVSVSLRIQRSNTVLRDSSESNALMFFGCWVLFSAPYSLNAGGVGGFGTLFHFIPLTVMSHALLMVVWKSRMTSENSTKERTSSLFYNVRLAPTMFLVGLAFVGLLSSPNGLREWRRIQLPVADLKWTDEWSSKRLDWIDVDVVNTLAESVGGPSEVGWWYAHGNAIEVLTGITNYLGLTVFEGAANSNSLLWIACEPISRERPKLIITVVDYLPLLDSCNGVAGNEIITQTNKPLVLVSLKYND